MVEIPPKDDPTAEWPEEVKEAYQHLKIPSLYDAVIANEKLSLEIRRQDRELKAMSENLQQLSAELHTLLENIEEDDEEDEEEWVEVSSEGPEEIGQDELTELEVELLQENQMYVERQSQLLLMETHDDMRELGRLTKQAIHQILSLLPKTEGLIPHEPIWHSIAEEMLQNLVESMEKSHYKLLTRLEEMHIELISPQPGETVNQALHRVVDHISGGKVGTIARIVRVGYRQNQEVLRLAEVTIYQ